MSEKDLERFDNLRAELDDLGTEYIEKGLCPMSVIQAMVQSIFTIACAMPNTTHDRMKNFISEYYEKVKHSFYLGDSNEKS